MLTGKGKFQNLIILLLLLVAQVAEAQRTASALVTDGATGQPIVGATVADAARGKLMAVTNADGRFSIPKNYEAQIKISYIGYRTLTVKAAVGAHYRMEPEVNRIGEVVVTAQESRGITSSSVIQKHAMEHLQPSSFSDILELLPGGRAKNPSLNGPNIIHLREAGGGTGNYSTTSLGVQFMVDGAPISTNANMQYLDGSDLMDRNHVNAGVDMRTIATDDIEKVEIVRGIPSVEYGDLTSGLVKIERRKGGHDLRFRLKADMGSKLFYAAKAFEWEQHRLSLNVSADYLDSKADPRNTLENYKRVTFSARMNKVWARDAYDLTFNTNADYTGSFDNEKQDPDINNNAEDSYRSQYNRMALLAQLGMRMKRALWLKSLDVTLSGAYQYDLIERRRLIQLNRSMPAAVHRTEGENDAVLLPWKYVAEHEVEGKPLNLYAKLAARLQVPSRTVPNTLLAGIDWNMDKNYGRGQVFDPLLPLYPSINSRERPLSAIPANHRMSFFVEENAKLPTAAGTLELQAGLRATEMFNLPSHYAMHGKMYFDPRLNAAWSFPRFTIAGKPVFIRLSGGIGQHTKMPTVEQLFPDLVYHDMVQLNYYHANPDYRRISLMTYVVDPANPELQAARNLKWELSADISVGGNRLSVTFFRERLTSGFRDQAYYLSRSYKEYDASAVNAATLTAKPDLTTLPYTVQQRLVGYSHYTNGSLTDKTGIEYTLETVRLPRIYTRLTISGAWFLTKFSNSQLEDYEPTDARGGAENRYIGLYDDNDGSMYQTLNTNFTFDTDVPRLKLGFSISAQFLWFTLQQRNEVSNTPSKYIAPDGTVHDWQPGDENDYYLSALLRKNNSSLYEMSREPWSMNLNLKVTKKLFAERLNVAMFCNKIWDITPDYDRQGYTIRRHVTPYFGLEMNVKI